MRARVIVMPKAQVSDPQGMTVRQGLHSLGFADVAKVRVGKCIELELEDSDADGAPRIEEMCRRLLANDVIEEYRVEVQDSA